jgi:hypothetical protein
MRGIQAVRLGFWSRLYLLLPATTSALSAIDEIDCPVLVRCERKRT